MKKILVTGAAGFVGSFLCEALVKRNYFVVGLDNLFRGNIENLAAIAGNPLFHFEKIDLALENNSPILNGLIKKHQLDTLFHLAAINGTQYFYDHALFVLDQNIKITQTLLSACENTTIDYMIYTSSSEVYGEPLHLPTPENHPILLNGFADRDSYAASKALGEFYVRLFAQKNGLRFLNLRVFNLYGERMVNTRYGQVIPEFISRMLSDDVFTMIGDGSHTRSFCSIQDAIHIIMQLTEKNHQGVINIGNNQEITILELAQKIHQLAEKPFKPHFLPERAHDHKRRCPDISGIQAMLPDFTFTPLEKGLKQVIGFYEKRDLCLEK